MNAHVDTYEPFVDLLVKRGFKRAFRTNVTNGRKVAGSIELYFELDRALLVTIHSDDSFKAMHRRIQTFLYFNWRQKGVAVPPGIPLQSVRINGIFAGEFCGGDLTLIDRFAEICEFVVPWRALPFSSLVHQVERDRLSQAQQDAFTGERLEMIPLKMRRVMGIR